MTIGYEDLPRPVSVGVGAGGSEAGDTAAGHCHAVQSGHVEPHSGAAGDDGESGDMRPMGGKLKAAIKKRIGEILNRPDLI